MAIQKHNTYYDTTKPNSGIYCYDENGNHKEVLTKNDLNAISSISSINDKVTTLSGKTVSEIKTTDTVTATPHTAPDGTIYYELEAAPEVSETEIYGENGISAKNQGTKWTIGLSADYLSANALDNLSGNWQNTFTAVTANSSVWDTVKDRVYSADFNPVKDDVDVLKTNSAHYPVESTNDFITVGSANHKFTLTFNSGDLVTSGWVEERLKDFGGFTTANPGISGEPAVDEPSTKLIYLVPDNTVTGKDKYSEWIYGTNSAWICIGETSIDLEPLYELSGKFIDHSVNENLHIQDGERTKWNEVSAKLNKDDFNSWSAKTESWDISAYSGGFGIDVTDHTISLTENYLSANALDNLSGKWEKASDTLIASSGKWNDTYETVSANSARWDKVDEKLDTSVFEAYTATADDIQYSGKNGIVIENHEVWISADYLSANALKDLSGKWENASDVVIADSAKWNSAYSAIASANLWNETYERVQASADEWNKVVNKLDKSESAKYMLVDKIDKTTDDKISGYNGLELYYPPVKEYSGKDGIKVEDYFICIDSGWLDERYQEKGDMSGYSTKTELQTVSADVTAISGELPNFALKSEIPNKVSDLIDSADYYKKTETSGATELSTEFAKYQTKGNYITSSDLVDSAKSATFAEYLTDGTDTSSFSEIKGSIDWCNTVADHYQTHSGEFVTSSISTITGTKQYALTSAGWVEVQAGSLSIPINVGTGNALNISTAESGTWGNNADGYLVIGHRSKAGNESFVFGNDSIAQNNSTVLNGGNSALHDSIAQGWKNIAIERSQAFGYNSSASNNSLAAGYSVVATDYSFAGGQAYNSTRGNILATDHSFALGVGSNNEPVIANKYSFAFGYAPSAQNFAFAFGKAIDVEGSDGHAVIGVGGYNVKIPSAAIIVGNGTNNARHNAFVVYNDGNVSAKNYKAEGYTDSNNNYVEASVPKSIPNTGDNSMKVQKMFVCTSDADIVAHAALANGEGCVFFRVG